jgi:flagellar biosynthesis protein FliQ
MTETGVLTLAQQAITLLLLISAPLLLASLVTGLVVSIFQAATQINEQTLTFIPKLVVTFLVIIAAGSWMIDRLVDFTQQLFASIPNLIG